MTYHPADLPPPSDEEMIRTDLLNGDMDEAGAILTLMDLYGWTVSTAREQVKDWQK